MADDASLSKGVRAAVIVLGALGVGTVGYLGFQGPSSGPTTAVSTGVSTGPEPQPSAPLASETPVEAPVAALAEDAAEPATATAEPVPDTAAENVPDPAPELVPEPVPEPAGDVAATPDAAPDSDAPENVAVVPLPELAPELALELAPEPDAEPADLTFDIVRVEPDGATVVAGQAAPDAEVELRLNDAVIATAQADGAGKFVAMFMLPPSAAPGLMSMRMRSPDGTEIVADATVAIAPIAAPVVVAAAEEPTAAPVVGAEATMDEPATRNEPELAAVDPAPAAPAALLVTDEGVTVLQGGESVGPDVSIDAIAYTAAGDVQLSGQAVPGQTLRVYLDNALITEMTPPSANWSMTLPETAPGIYALRIDQVDAAGKVTSRFETPFKRETREALAAVAAPVVSPPAAEPAPVVSKAVPDASAAAEVPETVAETEAAPVANTTDATVASPEAEPAAKDPADVTQTAVEPAVETAIKSAPDPVAVAAKAAPLPVTVTVQPGFTLWGIAQERFGNGVLYVQVFDANRDKIRDPDLIYPGQVFTIPAGSASP